jgi:hypothetical protein
MKYEFTGETQVKFGITFKRIRALVSIEVHGVAEGDLGGWIEKEENLARVYGDAQVYGNAHVCGNTQETPICVSGLAWSITITDTHMQIGCEFHSLKDWRSFTDERIAQMGGCQARRFWDGHKDMLLTLARSSGRVF